MEDDPIVLSSLCKSCKVGASAWSLLREELDSDGSEGSVEDDLN